MKSKRGFTIIELLVVVTIMLVMLGGGIAAFIKFNEKQKAISGGKLILEQLRSAQTLARIGEKPTGCTKLEGYRVSSYVEAGTTKIKVSPVCLPAISSADKITPLPDGVTLESSFNISFRGLHGGTNDPETKIVVKNNTIIYELTVTKGGEIIDTGLK